MCTNETFHEIWKASKVRFENFQYLRESDGLYYWNVNCISIAKNQ